MQQVSALNVPQSGPTVSTYAVACFDIIAGIRAVDIWGRLGWRETSRRYRRTVIGPFWSTASVAIFVVTLGLLWSRLWNQNATTYLPFLTAGMLCWVLFSTICIESCLGVISNEAIVKQLRISYTLLACAIVWRNVIVFLHNLSIYVLVCLFSGIALSWSILLVLPGFALFCLNALWISLLLGAVCARFRDIQQLVNCLLQVTLFLTPIFWSPSQLQGRAAVLVTLNPLYHLIAVVRDPMLGRTPDLLNWGAVGFMTVVGWTVTLLVMTRFRHRIVYWL